ncbi:MAG: CopG family ribbon-helix-helix protein [Methylophilaceae bacterium]
MASSSVVSVRINAEDEASLRQLAEATGSNKSKLVAEAIHHYVEINDWQTKLIRERLEIADRGEYASRDQAKAMFAKWGVNAG